MKRNLRSATYNKVGAEVQGHFLSVFNQLGGQEAFANWAMRNQTEFYRHYTRLLPTEVTAAIDTRDPSELSTEELLQVIRNLEGGLEGNSCESDISSTEEGTATVALVSKENRQ